MQSLPVRLLFVPLLLLILAAGAAFAACSDDDPDSGPADPPPATESPTPSDPSPEPEEPTPTQPPASGPIGVPAFDDLAEKFLDGDVPGVVGVIDYTELECANVQGAGGPPSCLEGETDGTVVSVMPFFSCEGEYMRERQVTALLESQVTRNPKLYAAFSLKDGGTADRPLGEYGILFELEGPAGIGPLGLMIGVDAEGDVIGMWAGCGATPAEVFERHAGGEVLLEPAA